MIVVVLTGSIGMGKSTTASLFAEEGAAVWDADAAVHRLYAPGGGAAGGIAEIAPAAVSGGGVDRGALSDLIRKDPDLLKKVEAVVHPLVAADRAAALASSSAEIAVLDIPLYFEGGGSTEADAVVVVTAPDAVRRRRVLERPGMTEAQLDFIVARQTPDAEKRRQADYLIWTHCGLDPARDAVRAVLADLRRRFAARLEAA
ncbi:MAG: dephospho-CoA kinase [Pseudomonadota bacterium]